MRRATAILLAVLSLTAVGWTKRDYKRAYEDATRELFIHRGLATALVLRGSYLSDTFRDAVAEERRRLVGVTDDDHATYVAQMRDDGARFHEVIFSADSAMEGPLVFGTSDAGWVVRLEADGAVEAPVLFRKVRDPSQLQRALFKHLTIWSDLWIARFERTVAEPREVVLTVGSGYGHGELRWTR